jgi:hypothetical protein
MSIARVGALAVLILVATGIDERIYGDAEDEVTRCDDEVAEFQAEVEKCLKKATTLAEARDCSEI